MLQPPCAENIRRYPAFSGLSGARINSEWQPLRCRFFEICLTSHKKFDANAIFQLNIHANKWIADQGWKCLALRLLFSRQGAHNSNFFGWSTWQSFSKLSEKWLPFSAKVESLPFCHKVYSMSCSWGCGVGNDMKDQVMGDHIRWKFGIWRCPRSRYTSDISISACNATLGKIVYYELWCHVVASDWMNVCNSWLNKYVHVELAVQEQSMNSRHSNSEEADFPWLTPRLFNNNSVKSKLSIWCPPHPSSPWGHHASSNPRAWGQYLDNPIIHVLTRWRCEDLSWNSEKPSLKI